MADYIDREELYKKIYKLAKQNNMPVDETLCVGVSVIRDMPSVDAVEVVRCKDCYHNNDGVCEFFMYEDVKWGLSTHSVDDNDYCKWGEKE